MRFDRSQQERLLGTAVLWLALRLGGTGIDPRGFPPPLQLERDYIYWLGGFLLLLVMYMVWITLQHYRY